MSSKPLFTLFTTSLIALAAPPALAGDLAGIISDAKARPVADMTVSIPALGLTTRTDAHGAYSFSDLPHGEHEIAVSLDEEAVQFASAMVPAEGLAKRNIFLFSRAAVSTTRHAHSPLSATEAARITREGMEAAEAMLQSADAMHTAPELLADASRA